MLISYVDLCLYMFNIDMILWHFLNVYFLDVNVLLIDDFNPSEKCYGMILPNIWKTCSKPPTRRYSTGFIFRDNLTNWPIQSMPSMKGHPSNKRRLGLELEGVAAYTQPNFLVLPQFPVFLLHPIFTMPFQQGEINYHLVI